mmetsp:Transcript_4108/g.9219  ORF Transcript_4108/g.9219 Transcript_4108/m.9219 type:complete len:83 (-) Transcript_4108:153-401(-)
MQYSPVFSTCDYLIWNWITVVYYNIFLSIRTASYKYNLHATPIHLRFSRQFEATDAKMLRVSMSTTYDMINVALKCFQEFGE